MLHCDDRANNLSRVNTNGHGRQSQRRNHSSTRRCGSSDEAVYTGDCVCGRARGKNRVLYTNDAREAYSVEEKTEGTLVLQQ